MAVPFAHPEYLVGTQWLAEHLADPQVRVLDGTTHLPPLPDLSLYDVVSGRADFEKGHIPGAGFVDIEHELSTPHPRLHFMLPTAEAFAAAMGRLGIGNDTHVVTYATGAPGAQAPRAFTARMRPEMVATREDILAAVGRGETCTVNALRPEQHAGTGGVHYGRRGHITGSVNIPALHHIRPDNTFRDADELRALFAPALAAPEVLTYCGGGIAATSVALVLAMLGHERVKVYDNSLTEWAADPALPMETGA
jgi:thiosulfate/3-mercaptopyruvate sulfurtransferase